MKRNIKIQSLACAALGLGLGTAVLAQSGVTVYGRINETVERQTLNGTSKSVLQNNSSRLGFRGLEDLGGGLKAGFTLEHRLNADTGASTNGTSFWGGAGESSVYLSSDLGQIKAGHYTSEAYYASADWVSNHNHDTGTSSDAFYAYVSDDSNKVSYRTPSMGGATVEVARSFAEGAPGANPTYDAAVNYATGPFQLGAGYAKNGDQKQFALRGYYADGPFGFGGYVQRDENVFATGTRTNIRVSGKYTLNQTEFHLNFGRAGDTGDVAQSAANQFTAGVNYNLSKRTKVYAFYTRVDDGDAHLYGGDFRSIALGVRHNF
jgi:predicted porin